MSDFLFHKPWILLQPKLHLFWLDSVDAGDILQMKSNRWNKSRLAANIEGRQVKRQTHMQKVWRTPEKDECWVRGKEDKNTRADVFIAHLKMKTLRVTFPWNKPNEKKNATPLLNIHTIYDDKYTHISALWSSKSYTSNRAIQADIYTHSFLHYFRTWFPSLCRIMYGFLFFFFIQQRQNSIKHGNEIPSWF